MGNMGLYDRRPNTHTTPTNASTDHWPATQLHESHGTLGAVLSKPGIDQGCRWLPPQLHQPSRCALELPGLDRCGVVRRLGGTGEGVGDFLEELVPVVLALEDGDARGMFLEHLRDT